MTDHMVMTLGVRGSVPVSGADFARYGGSTLCLLVRLAGQFILIDAGTGMLNLPQETLEETRLPLLLSHPHLDHLLGLTMNPFVFQKGKWLDIYAKPRLEPLENTLDRLYSPPLWPVRVSGLVADVGFYDLPESLAFGPVRVEVMEGVHPGGVSLFRLSGGGRRVTVITDCTLTPELWPKAEDFARESDLLLIDGQYSEEEWPNRATFGHNTWRMAAQLGQDCGAKRVVILHHAPERTDTALDEAELDAQSVCPCCTFAKEGGMIEL